MFLLLFPLAFNIVILIPVIGILFFSPERASYVFGDLTDGRLILTSVYAAIALVSTGLIALVLLGAPWALPMCLALFSVQITYKLLTVPLIGLESPVVMTNLLVVIVQLAALLWIWSSALV